MIFTPSLSHNHWLTNYYKFTALHFAVRGCQHRSPCARGLSLCARGGAWQGLVEGSGPAAPLPQPLPAPPGRRLGPVRPPSRPPARAHWQVTATPTPAVTLRRGQTPAATPTPAAAATPTVAVAAVTTAAVTTQTVAAAAVFGVVAAAAADGDGCDGGGGGRWLAGDGGRSQPGPTGAKWGRRVL
jgi:hypothetical protein